MLLTGDIEAPSEWALLHAEPSMLASDVLVVPHHGSRTSSTPAFVEGVSPGVAIFAAGYRNRFGHPRDEIVSRYRRSGAARWRTDLQGAIIVVLEAGRPVVVAAQRDVRRRYWYDALAD